jgi:UDP-GlcNAc3NAcA epimerase
MKIVTVVGARPQFIKAAAFSRALAQRRRSDVREVMVHTGQHYDVKMSDVFFEELGIGEPAYNLGISGGTHGAMTGRMLEALERVMMAERPDWVVVYGDTNSTLAAALAASKLHLPIAHVEAGLRSFNGRMPEEINRIVADRLSSLLLCPTEASMRNLAAEGLSRHAHRVGDVMYDAALHFAAIAGRHAGILTRLGVAPKRYVLATCHRAENTDDRRKLEGIMVGLASIAGSMSVVFPVHPRTRSKLQEFGLDARLGGVTTIDPVSYLEMVALEQSAALIVTDSGGVQKEAFFYRVPCVTTRDETEWVETVEAGWNTLTSSDAGRIADAFERRGAAERRDIRPYGTGDAAQRIVDLLLAT